MFRQQNLVSGYRGLNTVDGRPVDSLVSWVARHCHKSPKTVAESLPEWMTLGRLSHCSRVRSPAVPLLQGSFTPPLIPPVQTVRISRCSDVP